MVAANNGKPPGFFGILEATSRIISHTFQHFLCLSAFLLLIPFALYSSFVPTRPHKTQTVAAFLAQISVLVNSTPSLDLAEVQPRQYLHFLPPLLGFGFGFAPRQHLQFLPLLLRFGFTLFLTILAVPPLTVSVYRAYLNKDLRIKSSLQAIPEVFTRILLTFVCYVAAFTLILFLYSTNPDFVAAFMVVLLKVPDPTLTVFLTRFLTWSLQALCIIYFNVLWSLAPIVCILEQKWGFKALQRSSQLVHGRTQIGLSLTALFHVCLIFVPISISKEAPVPARFSVAALSVVSWALLSLYNVTSTVVFYVSCKEYHNESLETLPTTTQSSLEHSASEYKELNSPNHESFLTM